MLILWLLSEQPVHGYRISRILKDDFFGYWFPLEDTSIYSCLRTLVKHGYARVVATEQEGRRPERTRYAVTAKGRAHLRDLLRRAWRELPAPAEPIHLALAALPELPEAELAMLRAERRAALDRRLADLRRGRRAAPCPDMVDRLATLTRAELAWLKRLPGSATPSSGTGNPNAQEPTRRNK
jgi:DNA-binding PadR family transcriptional regulator